MLCALMLERYATLVFQIRFAAICDGSILCMGVSAIFHDSLIRISVSAICYQIVICMGVTAINHNSVSSIEASSI